MYLFTYLFQLNHKRILNEYGIYSQCHTYSQKPSFGDPRAFTSEMKNKIYFKVKMPDFGFSTLTKVHVF